VLAKKRLLSLALALGFASVAVTARADTQISTSSLPISSSVIGMCVATNVGSKTVTVRLDLVDAGGTAVASDEAQLPPNGIAAISPSESPGLAYCRVTGKFQKANLRLVGWILQLNGTPQTAVQGY